ncbi:MAG: hypothetical protein V7641_1669 [Blastocatellia bacterium]
MTKPSGKVYLWRGALGGAIGSVLADIILPKFQYGPGTKWFFFLLSLIITTPIAALIGAMIGAIVWKSPRWARREIGPTFSAIIGAILVGIALVYLSYVRYDEIQRAIVGPSYLIAASIRGILIGAGAGLAAGMLNYIPYPAKRPIK